MNQGVTGLGVAEVNALVLEFHFLNQKDAKPK